MTVCCQVMPYSAAGQTFTDLVLLVFQINGALLEAGNRMTAPVGQTSARWQVMGCIDDQAMTVSGIARVMGLARQSVQRTADLLVQDGLAAYEDNPDHKRAKLLRLTSSGQNALNVIEAAQLEWANRIGEQLRLATLEQTKASLEQLRDLLEEDMQTPSS
jgi:DNA-binding MarR family transcriptional regulator